MQPLTLFRAVAYRLQRTSTAPGDRWPDLTVYVEAQSHADAFGRMQSLLSFMWGCHVGDVELISMSSEIELIHGGSFGDFEAMDDVALLVTGWNHGPLFARADRTLMLVSPPALKRLHAARLAARPYFMQQRANAQHADAQVRAQATRRHGEMRERMEGAHATGFGSL